MPSTRMNVDSNLNLLFTFIFIVWESNCVQREAPLYIMLSSFQMYSFDIQINETCDSIKNNGNEIFILPL